MEKPPRMKLGGFLAGNRYPQIVRSNNYKWWS